MQKIILEMKTKTTITIKEWANEDKPREKMLAKGKKELTNAELIGILLGSGSAGQSAVDLAKAILDQHHGSLNELSHTKITTLIKHKGVGTAKAVTVTAALELATRMQSELCRDDKPIISQSKDLFNYIGYDIADIPHEEFWAIYLNNRGKVLHKERISMGGITSTSVDVRMIFKTALEHNAVLIGLAHNHPSGGLKPSTQDNAITQVIVNAGTLLNIRIIDHIIVGMPTGNKADYYSYADNGNL